MKNALYTALLFFLSASTCSAEALVGFCKTGVGAGELTTMFMAADAIPLGEEESRFTFDPKTEKSASFSCGPYRFEMKSESFDMHFGTKDYFALVHIYKHNRSIGKTYVSDICDKDYRDPLYKCATEWSKTISFEWSGEKETDHHAIRLHRAYTEDIRSSP